jgi:hypothetical protein
VSLKSIWERRTVARPLPKPKVVPNVRHAIRRGWVPQSDVPLCSMNGGQGPTLRDIRDCVHVDVFDEMCDECKYDVAECINADRSLHEKFGRLRSLRCRNVRP